MKLAILVACLALLAVVAVDAHAHAGSENLSRAAKQAQLSTALKIDWRRSLYNGVERSQDSEPSQVKVSFIPSGVAISFSTPQAYAAGSVPQVNYGPSPSELNQQASATDEYNLTYGTIYFHTVLLKSLAPATTFYYQVVGDSDVYSFTTARQAGDATPFNVLVVGDMGLANSAPTIQQMNDQVNQTDFYMHIGDLSYADDFVLRPENTYEGSWDAWQDEMEPITANIPYQTLPGNHEVVCNEVGPFLCPANQNNMTAYRYRFRMMGPETGGVGNLWYSYDYGLVHFIHIDTETDYPDAPMGPGTYYNAGPFGDQLTWLEADLIAAQSQRESGVTPWIIVSGHRPLYSSKKKTKEAIAAFEALFLKYNVDVYFAGHVHWYERLWPMGAGGVVTQQNYINPTGIVYIINGAGGNVEGHNVGDQAPFSAYLDDSDYGFGKLLVANSTALNWQFFHATDGSQGDDVWIIKEH